MCIILNWNGLHDTVRCLDALKGCTYSPLSAIVVDNGSSDDSVARIRKAHPDVVVMESGRNLGFAAGNNIGIRYALDHGAEYVWLLNNDTEAASDALSALNRIRRLVRWLRFVILLTLRRRSKHGPPHALTCGLVTAD